MADGRASLQQRPGILKGWKVVGVALTLTLPLVLALAGDRPPAARATGHIGLPPLMLWAWDRDDDLRFVEAGETGVAYLAATLTLRGDAVDLAPRHNPLALPAGVSRVAVVHVESDRAARRG